MAVDLTDPGLLWLALLAPLALTWYARSRLSQRYNRYQQRANRRFASGLDAARYLLDRLGLRHVGIERAHGRLADHYDPITKVLRLSPEVAGRRSIAAIGIVAHEVGHAHQDATGYPLLALQQRLSLYIAPFARAAGWLALGGIVFGVSSLVLLAGIGVGGAVLVGLVSLPVERDASRRAVAALRRTGLADEIDVEGVREVLSAAAFTYLAGLAHRLSTLVAFLALIQLFGVRL